jgi:hypothetical protein
MIRRRGAVVPSPGTVAVTTALSVVREMDNRLLIGEAGRQDHRAKPQLQRGAFP